MLVSASSLCSPGLHTVGVQKVLEELLLLGMKAVYSQGHQRKQTVHGQREESCRDPREGTAW